MFENLTNLFWEKYYDIKKYFIHKKIRKYCKNGGFESLYCIQAVIEETAKFQKSEFYTRKKFKNELDHFYNVNPELRDK